MSDDDNLIDYDAPLTELERLQRAEAEIVRLKDELGACLVEANDTSVEHVMALEQERDAALADAAAQKAIRQRARDLAIIVSDELEMVGVEPGHWQQLIDALVPTAGADLLERLRQAESEIATWKKTHSEMVSFLGSEGGKLLDRAQKAEAQRDALVEAAKPFLAMYQEHRKGLMTPDDKTKDGK